MSHDHLGVVIGHDGNRLYGFDAELFVKMEAKRDHQWEARVLDWVEQVVEIPLIDKTDAWISLKNGVVLCNLVNKLRPNTIKTFATTKLHALRERDNIQLFLKACWQLGLSSDKLFSTSDLYNRKAMTNVFTCLAALSKASRSLGWQGVTIEPMPLAGRNRSGSSDRASTSSDAKKWATVDAAPKLIHTDLTKEGQEKVILDLRLQVAKLEENMRRQKGDIASLTVEVKEYKKREQRRRDRRRAGLNPDEADAAAEDSSGIKAQQDLTELRTKHAETLESLKQLQASLEEEKERYGGKVKAMELDLDQQKETLKEIKKQAEELAQEKGSLEDSLKKANEKLAARAQAYKGLEAQLQETNDALSQETSKLKDLEIEKAELIRNAGDLEAKLKGPLEATARFEEQVAALNAEKQSIRSELGAELEESKKREQKLKDEKMQVHETLNTISEEMETLEDKVGMLEKQKKVLQDRLTELTKDFEAMEKAQRGLEEDKQSAARRITELEETVQRLEETVKVGNESKQKLEANLADMSDTVQDLELEITKLRLQAEQLNKNRVSEEPAKPARQEITETKAENTDVPEEHIHASQEAKEKAPADEETAEVSEENKEAPSDDLEGQESTKSDASKRKAIKLPPPVKAQPKLSEEAAANSLGSTDAAIEILKLQRQVEALQQQLGIAPPVQTDKGGKNNKRRNSKFGRGMNELTLSVVSEDSEEAPDEDEFSSGFYVSEEIPKSVLDEMRDLLNRLLEDRTVEYEQVRNLGTEIMKTESGRRTFAFMLEQTMEKVDLAAPTWVHKKANFTKHGRHGDPHTRMLKVSAEGKGVVDWGTGKLKLKRAIDIVKGKQTYAWERETRKALKRGKEPISEDLCLSIITADRTLDLQCSTVKMRDDWYTLLKGIHQKVKIKEEDAPLMLQDLNFQCLTYLINKLLRELTQQSNKDWQVVFILMKAVPKLATRERGAALTLKHFVKGHFRTLPSDFWEEHFWQETSELLEAERSKHEEEKGVKEEGSDDQILSIPTKVLPWLSAKIKTYAVSLFQWGLADRDIKEFIKSLHSSATITDQVMFELFRAIDEGKKKQDKQEKEAEKVKKAEVVRQHKLSCSASSSNLQLTSAGSSPKAQTASISTSEGGAGEQKKKRGSILHRVSPFVRAGSSTEASAEKEKSKEEEEGESELLPLSQSSKGVLLTTKAPEQQELTEKELHKQKMKKRERRPSEHLASDAHSMYL